MAKKTRYCLACRTAVTRWGSVGRPESIAWEYIALACRGAAAAHRGYHEDMRFPRAVLIFLVLSWILVVLYPDPGVLVHSVRNTLHPQIDPAAVRGLAARLPNDPKAVEAYVLDRAVPYAYDWQSAGVPWYFPTTREALRVGRGDCESRAVVLASILTAKGIPNELRMSFDHIWVDYPGKQANSLENARVVFAGRRGGHFFIHWPKDFNLGQEVADQVAIFWTPAPPGRVLLLALGLLLIPLWNVLARVFAGGGLVPRGDGLRAGAPPLILTGPPASRRVRRRLRRRLRQRGLAAHPQRV